MHNGHLNIIDVAARHFDEVVVAAVRNPQKGEPLFTIAELLGHKDVRTTKIYTHVGKNHLQDAVDKLGAA